MSRYIEIDTALLKTVATGGLSAKALWKRIMQQPSIDIVRCKECRYWHSGECWGIPYRGDYDTSIDTKADDFCSYGEREGE